jgi:hypothetical protein
MSGVFQIIDPLTARPVCIPPPLVLGENTLAGGEGVGVNILEDARHCSVLYIRKYFVKNYIKLYTPHPTEPSRTLNIFLKSVLWSKLHI